jgi:hypothetical protein
VVLRNGWLGNHGDDSDEAMDEIQFEQGLARLSRMKDESTGMLAGRGAEMGWLAQGYFIVVGMGQATQFDLIDMVRCTDNGGPGWPAQSARDGK